MGSISTVTLCLRAASAAARQIADERGLGRRPLLGRDLAGEAMNLPSADRAHVIERLPEQEHEVGLPPRQRGEAEFVGPAGCRIDAQDREIVPGELGPHRRRSVIIGKLQLDRLEAGRGGRGEAFDERPLGEQVGQIGGEPGHVTAVAKVRAPVERATGAQGSNAPAP